MRAWAVSIVALAALLAAAPGDAAAWPKLIHGVGAPVCRQALALAEAMFRSDAFYLYAPPAVPQTVGVDLVLGPDALAISGGDALISNASALEKIADSRAIYRQIAPQDGVRWMVVEHAGGWRGDTYGLNAVPQSMTGAAFLTAAHADPARDGPGLLAGGYRPPLMLRDRTSGRMWAIDVGETFNPFAPWTVFATTAAGAGSPCSIAFAPPYASAHEPILAAARLLPGPTRRLAEALDRTIGSGQGEGTLQQTAQLRSDAAYAWANVALRPWALADTVYNSRAEVDAGLLAWSRQDPVSRARFRMTAAMYGPAERALAGYYRRRFALPPGRARKLAAFATDIGYRSSYIFHSDRPHDGAQPPAGATPNPWRAGLPPAPRPSR